MSNSNEFIEYLRQMDNWKKKILSSIWPKITKKIQSAQLDILPVDGQENEEREKRIALRVLADFMDCEGGVLLSDKPPSLPIEYRYLALDADGPLSAVRTVQYNEYFEHVRKANYAVVWRSEIEGKLLKFGDAQVRCLMTTFLDEKVSEILSLGPQPFFASVLNTYASKATNRRRVMPSIYWPSPSEVEFAALVPVVLVASRAHTPLFSEHLLHNYDEAKKREKLDAVRNCFKSLIEWNCSHFNGFGVNAYLRDVVNFLIQWAIKHPGRARQIIDILYECQRYFDYAVNKRSAASVLAKAYFFLSRIPVAGAYRAGQHYLSLSLKE